MPWTTQWRKCRGEEKPVPGLKGLSLNPTLLATEKTAYIKQWHKGPVVVQPEGIPLKS